MSRRGDPARHLLPPRSANRTRRERALGLVADAGMDLRARALGVGRELDAVAAELAPREVLVLGVYTEHGAATMAAALDRLAASRHRVRVVVGALGATDPRLAAVTAATEMRAGKLANVNRLAERAMPLAADWVLVLDDDVELPVRFLDRLLAVCEVLRLDLAQPALRRASHTAWEVVRRRAGVARQTRFVEVGPVTLMSREVFRTLTPFPEQGMGWGVDQHWARRALDAGWRVGVVDAVPIRHDARPTGSAYPFAEAASAAREFLAAHPHLRWAEAEHTVAAHRHLP